MCGAILVAEGSDPSRLEITHRQSAVKRPLLLLSQRFSCARASLGAFLAAEEEPIARAADQMLLAEQLRCEHRGFGQVSTEDHL